MVGSDENRKYGLFKKILKKIYEFEECVNGLLVAPSFSFY
jgi:hypothetical protein